MGVASDVANEDGSHTVTLAGAIPLGLTSYLLPYNVSKPSRFAEVVLVEALREAGISADLSAPESKPDFKKLAASYVPANLVAEHISPPLSEDVKVTLKVSQNLHASMMPFLLAAVLAPSTQAAEGSSRGQAGFNLEHEYLQKAGLDLSGASQADGAGADAYFTPDFMVHYLAYMAKQKSYPQFLNALPILGHDGTLNTTSRNSPAAGHVFAKTGTAMTYNALNSNFIAIGKALAGYMTTADGRHLAFAIFANHIPANPDFKAVEQVGQALADVAEAAYSYQP